MRRVREFGLIVGGQILGQAALLLVIPVLTRIFTPDEFGSYQVALAASLLLQPIATLRLEFIIPVTHGSRRISRFYWLGMGITLTMSASAITAGIVLGQLWRDNTWSWLLEMTGLLLLVNAWTAIDNARLIRGGRSGRLATRNLLAGVLAAALQLIVGLVAPEVVLLAVSVAVARGLAILVTLEWRPVDSHATGESEPKYGVARAITTVSAGVVSNASIYGLTLLVGGMYGSAASGQVGTAQRITSTPVSLAGQALAQYFQAKAASTIRSNSPRLASNTVRFTGLLALAAVPLALAMILLGPVLAVPVLGEGWQEAGYVIAILAVPTALQLVIAPTVPLLVMLGRERLLLVMQIVRLTISVACGAVPGLLTGNLFAACIGYSVATSAAYALTFAITASVARRFDRLARAEAGPVE